MLFVAFLYSLSVNYDKEVVINSSPIFGSALVLVLLAAIFLVIAALTGTRSVITGNVPRDPDPARSPPPSSWSRLLRYGTVGMLLVVEAISINIAYTLAIVPYVITIKRLSIFFSVLFGGLLLHEQDIRGRMTGALVMIAGAAVIGLWG